MAGRVLRVGDEEGHGVRQLAMPGEISAQSRVVGLRLGQLDHGVVSDEDEHAPHSRSELLVDRRPLQHTCS